MELAASPSGASRTHHPHQHPHHYEPYPPSPPHRSAAPPGHTPSSSSKRREQEYPPPASFQQGGPPPPPLQEQQQQAYSTGHPQHHMGQYYPELPHESPRQPHQSSASASARHTGAYPQDIGPSGYQLPPPPIAGHSHPHHPGAQAHHPVTNAAGQPYPAHHMSHSQHMGLPYYEDQMMDMDPQAQAHYAAQHQQQMGYPHPQAPMGYAPPVPLPQREHHAHQQQHHPSRANPSNSHSQGQSAPQAKPKAKSTAPKKDKPEKKQTGAGTKASNSAAAKAQAAKDAKAEAALAAKESSESKKDKKRREVVDRVHRMHWDTMETRDEVFHEMQQHYLHEHQILLGSPLLSREYALNASLLTLQREAASREVTLLHAHQVEVARKAYEIEKGKIEEEARQAKRLVRERLMAAVDDRRRMLKEEKESGEGGADTLMDSSSRPHATRKLRNKHTSASRRLAFAGGDIDSGDESSVGGSTSGPAGVASAKDRNHKDNHAESSRANHASGSAAAFGYLSGSKCMEGIAPILGLAGLPDLSLLQSSLTVFDGPEDARAATNGRKGKKGKGKNAKKRPAAAQPEDDVSALATSLVPPMTKKQKRELQRDQLAFLALAASCLPTLSSMAASSSSVGAGNSSSGNAQGSGGANGTAGGASGNGASGVNGVAVSTNGVSVSSTLPGLTNLTAGPGPGGSRSLRWEPGRSVLQLTGAKDYETESDLIRIRGGVGGGKRRRGAAAAAAAAGSAMAII